MWDRVCECISDIFTASLPTELLTWKPPECLYRTQSNVSLASSFSSISEAPLPPRLVSVASVESSVLETSAAVDKEKEIVTEAPVTPEVTVIPSSPPQSKETVEMNDTISTNASTNVQDDGKNPSDISGNTPSDTLNDIVSDALDNVSSNALGDVPSDKTAIIDAAQSHSHVQELVQDTVVEETVEDALLNEETDHHPSHDTPQHHVSTSSGKSPVAKKQAQLKEKKQRTGSFLQRRKKDSSSSTGAKKRKSNVATNAIGVDNKKENIVKKHNHKLSHLQSPDADLAKSKFNKIGEHLLHAVMNCGILT